MTADVPVVEVVAVDAVLDALDTPTSSEVYSAVEPFSNSAVAAAAAARAIAGGGGGSLPDPITTPLTVALPAGGSILAGTIDTLDDAEVSLDIEDNGAVTLSLSAGEGADGLATINLGDDDFDGSITLTTGTGSQISPRSTLDVGDAAFAIGAGVDRLRVLRDGYIVIRNHAAPDDTALDAGDMAIWFDQTNGAGKLMIRARTANGTFATGEIALA